MPKRKSISASMRWTVFSRDSFTCRYCGVRAGQEGIVLHADHIISVADGGDDSIHNLLTACQRCNGGKGARSLKAMPDAPDIAARMADRADSIKQQAKAMRSAMEAEKELQQQAINLKCEAYGVESTHMASGETTLILSLCKEFGAETVLYWYRSAEGRRVSEYKAIKYVCGCARNSREN